MREGEHNLSTFICHSPILDKQRAYPWIGLFRSVFQSTRKNALKVWSFFFFFFFFPIFLKKEGFETERIGCVYQVLFQCFHMETGTILQPAADNWTVRPGTNGLRGCIYHITFSLSVLSTDTWHHFSNISTWADRVNATVATPLHTHRNRQLPSEAGSEQC